MAIFFKNSFYKDKFNFKYDLTSTLKILEFLIKDTYIFDLIIKYKFLRKF